MNEHIVKFIEKQTCASVCCTDQEENPYCFSCFYAFNKTDGLLYFKSSLDTHHSGLLLKKPFIAGTILPDKLNILRVKGIQFEGIILPDTDPLTGQAFSIYHKKHPVALTMHGEIWTIKLTSIKMTDNSLGFGKKITWQIAEKNLV